MEARIAILPGDGVGVEVTAEAVRVLRCVGERWGHRFELVEGLIGSAAAEQAEDGLPRETLALSLESDAVLLGAVGGPAGRGLLELRREMDVYANIRPYVPMPGAADASPLRPELLEGVDLLIVRELTGGFYFGERVEEEDRASDSGSYSASEIERVTRIACELAKGRRGKLTSIDKSNVLATSRLWRRVVTRVVETEFPDLQLEHLLVDAAAMHLLRCPVSFDVIVTANLFGDILSDEASMLCGSLGMCPSASIGDGPRGLYEPVHGSAPDIAGKGIANPTGAILSAAMLLRHSLGLQEEADAVTRAVSKTLAGGVLTRDIAGAKRPVGTGAFTDAVLQGLVG